MLDGKARAAARVSTFWTQSRPPAHDLRTPPLGITGRDRLNAGKMAEPVPPLRCVPPAQRLDLNADFFEGRLGPLDLNLRPPVRQAERDVVVEKHLHSHSSA